MGLTFDFSKLLPQDVLDLGVFAEQEAQEQYEHLTDLMVAGGNAEAAEFFRTMAGREHRHGEQIAERRRALFPDAKPTIANRAIWEIEAADEARVRPGMSVREALDAAMVGEVRAYDYYSEALEHALSAQVEELFRGLQQAELEHQRLLRAEMAKLGGSGTGDRG